MGLGVASMPDMAGVPLLLGIPGASVKDVRLGRVLIGWAGADPSKPYAEAFDADATVKTLVLAVSGTAPQLFLGGEAGAQPLVTQPLLSALTTFLGAMNAYVLALAAIDPTGGSASSAMEAAIAALEGAVPAAVTSTVSGL